MRRIFTLLAAALMVLVGIALAPTAHSAMVQDTQNMVGIYLDDPVSMNAPAGAADKVMSACPVTQGQNGPCYPHPLGGCFIQFKEMADNGMNAQAYKVTSDFVGTIWLSATGGPGVLRGIQWQLINMKGGNANPIATLTHDALVKDENGDQIVLDTTPQKISLGFKKVGAVNVPKDALIGIKLCVMTEGVKDSTQAPDVRIHFGSVAHASGLFYTVDVPVPAAKRVGSGLFRMSLAEKGFRFSHPDGTTSKEEPLPGDFPTPKTTRWAEGVADRAYTFTTDTVFNATLTFPGAQGDASGIVDLAVTLTLNKKAITAHVQDTVSSSPGATDTPHTDLCPQATSCPATINLVVALPTAGIKLNKSDPVAVDFILTAKGTKDYKLVYDSVLRPSGFLAGAMTAGPQALVGGSGSTGSPTPTPTTNSTNSGNNTPTSETVTPESTATSTTAPASGGGANSTDQAGRQKDVGNPAQALPNVTFALALAALAAGLGWARRRR